MFREIVLTFEIKYDGVEYRLTQLFLLQKLRAFLTRVYLTVKCKILLGIISIAIFIYLQIRMNVSKIMVTVDNFAKTLLDLTRVCAKMDTS